MSNTLYDSGRALMLQSFDWAAVGVDAYLIDTTKYTLDATNHSTLANVADASVVAGPVALASKAVVAGAADAADVTFSAVTGATSQAILLTKRVGSSAAEADVLLAYIDTATGLPITPNGGDIIIVWDNGTNRIFKP